MAVHETDAPGSWWQKAKSVHTFPQHSYFKENDMSFTGRRNTGAAKRFFSAVGNGLDALGTVMNDGPKHARIAEIDKLVVDLLQEKDHLIAGLYEPGDLKVSENYNPNWAKPVSPASAPTGEGRLVHCEGRDTMSVFHDAHPACPYLETRHNAHDFTARD